MVLPPGTILQFMYLEERLRRLQAGSFVEAGVGRGHLSARLLTLGWQGAGYEMDRESAHAARAVNRDAIAAGRYRVIEGSWLDALPGPKVDLVLSSMVLEHLSEADELRYLRRCREVLAPDGTGILLVPGSPPDWGIEDETAGHYRRYTYARLDELLRSERWSVRHMAGLTYPLSNALLPLSNYLVRRHESHKRGLSMQERTAASGKREVPGKTRFPGFMGLALNEITMYPFHLLQKLCTRARRALVIYVEFAPVT
jgi:SAM-dependent methyltransferase